MATQAQTPVTCELCESNIDVSFYCVTCGLVICSKCKLIHARIPRTKNDEVISLSEARQHKKSKPIVTLCNKHATEEISMFCERCDKFICNECLVENHQGHQFTTTKNKICAKKVELAGFLTEIQNKKEILKKALNTENSVHTTNTQCYYQIRTGISEHVDQIIKEFSSIREEKFTELSTLQKKENERHSDACTYIQSQSEILSTAIQLVQTAIDSENPVTMETAKTEATEFVQNAHIPPEPLKEETIYAPGNIDRPITILLFGDMLKGRYVINTNKVKIKSALIVKDEGTMENIRAIIPTTLDTTWIAEADEDTQLTMIKKDGNTVRKSVHLCDGDFTITDAQQYNNDILVSIYKQQKLIRMSGDGRTKTTFSDVSPYYPLGLCVTHVMDVLVCLKSVLGGHHDKDAKVVRLNRNGDVIQSIQRNDKGDMMYSWPFSVTSLQSGEVIVCDRDQHMRVSCVNSEGHLMFTWSGEVGGKKSDKFDPYCITHDKYNNLFITDFNNHRVWVLSKDGAEAKCLMDNIQGMKYPYGIAVDIRGHLWVCCEGGRIHIIEY